MWGDFGHFISEYQVINNNTLCRKYSLSCVQFKFFRLPDTFTLQICPICGKNVIIASLRREKKPKFSIFSALISPFTSPKNCLILPTSPNQIRKVTSDIPELSSEGQTANIVIAFDQYVINQSYIWVVKVTPLVKVTPTYGTE